MFDFPEPLFESHLQDERMCLVCARNLASSVLRTPSKEIVPLCSSCATDWNIYGYNILRRIKPGRLLKRAVLFKLRHPLRPSIRTITRDIKSLQNWAAKMRRWM
jgi:hypothetical protein